MVMNMKIEMSYGSGGKQTSNLINNIFLKHFNNKILNKLEDAAVFQLKGKIAFTTDSFVVTPLFLTVEILENCLSAGR